MQFFFLSATHVLLVVQFALINCALPANWRVRVSQSRTGQCFACGPLPDGTENCFQVRFRKTRAGITFYVGQDMEVEPKHAEFPLTRSEVVAQPGRAGCPLTVNGNIPTTVATEKSDDNLYIGRPLKVVLEEMDATSS
ncbi:hypothetical protein DdX_10997 [Ditylenchus destructor]|uniref:Secreted protein n=1 Tax=Ditylenchus destructor TaxID=166010 RepID=A0AAD4N072_9BILA|nr:hypothetical protein DdX_10997 [Ditylenchus destructor]